MVYNDAYQSRNDEKEGITTGHHKSVGVTQKRMLLFGAVQQDGKVVEDLTGRHILEFIRSVVNL